MNNATRPRFTRSIKRLLTAFPLLLLAGCQATYFGLINAGRHPSNQLTQTYDPAHQLKLDVFPASGNKRSDAVAIFFYGGAWREGKRQQYAFVGDALAQQGILTFVVDYRTYPDARFPGFMHDAAKAVRWVREHAHAYGGDPQRIFLVGHSAGAHIAALLATDDSYLKAESMRAQQLAGVVGIAGPYDFLPLTDPKLVAVFGQRNDWPASQPVNFVDGHEPPFLLLQGNKDERVDPRNADSLEAKLRSVDVPVQQVRYPNAGHVKILAGFRFKWAAPTLADSARFIRAGDHREADDARSAGQEY